MLGNTCVQEMEVMARVTNITVEPLSWASELVRRPATRDLFQILQISRDSLSQIDTRPDTVPPRSVVDGILTPRLPYAKLGKLWDGRNDGLGLARYCGRGDLAWDRAEVGETRIVDEGALYGWLVMVCCVAVA